VAAAGRTLPQDQLNLSTFSGLQTLTDPYCLPCRPLLLFQDFMMPEIYEPGRAASTGSFLLSTLNCFRPTQSTPPSAAGKTISQSSLPTRKYVTSQATKLKLQKTCIASTNYSQLSTPFFHGSMPGLRRAPRIQRPGDTVALLLRKQ
jgi:hypothetical protein